MNLENQGNEELKFLYVVLVWWLKTRFSFVFFHLYQSSFLFQLFSTTNVFLSHVFRIEEKGDAWKAIRKYSSFPSFFTSESSTFSDSFNSISLKASRIRRILRDSFKLISVPALNSIFLSISSSYLVIILKLRLFSSIFSSFLSKFSSLYQLIIHG